MTVYMEFSDRVHLFLTVCIFFGKDCIICVKISKVFSKNWNSPAFYRFVDFVIFLQLYRFMCCPTLSVPQSYSKNKDVD